jgi:hypothetical protein
MYTHTHLYKYIYIYIYINKYTHIQVLGTDDPDPYLRDLFAAPERHAWRQFVEGPLEIENATCQVCVCVCVFVCDCIQMCVFVEGPLKMPHISYACVCV